MRKNINLQGLGWGLALFLALGPCALAESNALQKVDCHLVLSMFAQDLNPLMDPIVPTSCRDSHKIQISADPAKSAEQREVFNQCETKLLQRCNPNLNPVVSETTLNNFYSELRKNSLFLTADPGGACERRAYLINKLLAEAGYRSERIYISAPVIVGAITDDEGKISSVHKYNWHAVVAIQMRSETGKAQAMILDPEFFATPVPIADYFIRTTGQNCQESERASAQGYHCTFERRSANYRADFDEGEIGPTSASLLKSCGWSVAENYLHNLEKLARRSKAEAAVAGNVEPLPFSVDPKLGFERSALGWALDDYHVKLIKNKKEYEQRLQNLERTMEKGEMHYYQTERFKSGNAERQEISQSMLDAWDSELKSINQALNDFDVERARILRMEK